MQQIYESSDTVGYARRSTLELIRKQGRFGCGVPFRTPQVLDAIRYAGNVSFAADPRKVCNSGLTIGCANGSPYLRELPVNFACEVIGEISLGTHVMFLGEVKEILVRKDLTAANPMTWRPWAKLVPTGMMEAAA